MSIIHNKRTAPLNVSAVVDEIIIDFAEPDFSKIITKSVLGRRHISVVTQTIGATGFATTPITVKESVNESGSSAQDCASGAVSLTPTVTGIAVEQEITASMEYLVLEIAGTIASAGKLIITITSTSH